MPSMSPPIVDGYRCRRSSVTSYAFNYRTETDLREQDSRRSAWLRSCRLRTVLERLRGVLLPICFQSVWNPLTQPSTSFIGQGSVSSIASTSAVMLDSERTNHCISGEDPVHRGVRKGPRPTWSTSGSSVTAAVPGVPCSSALGPGGLGASGRTVMALGTVWPIVSRGLSLSPASGLIRSAKLRRSRLLVHGRTRAFPCAVLDCP